MRALPNPVMRLFEHLVVACMAIMVVLVFGNVVLRYGFNSGISVSEEAARFLFVWLTFIGAVVAMADHSHLGVDALVRRLPRVGRLLCLVVGHGLMLFCCGLFLVGSWKQTVLNLGNALPVSGMPLGLMYAAGIVSSLAIGSILLIDLWRALTGRLSDEELAQVRATEERADVGAAR
jgi:TRAP-type C4-dicarboxylate transport system permease small subunit